MARCSPFVSVPQSVFSSASVYISRLYDSNPDKFDSVSHHRNKDGNCFEVFLEMAYAVTEQKLVENLYKAYGSLLLLTTVPREKRAF